MYSGPVPSCVGIANNESIVGAISYVAVYVIVYSHGSFTLDLEETSVEGFLLSN